MSATYDKSQRVTFVYSNLYQLYKKGKEAAKQSPSYHVLKTGKLNQNSPEEQKSWQSQIKIRGFEPPELLTKRMKQKEVAPAAVQSRCQVSLSHQASDQAVQGLRKNLDSLSELQSRLRFMLHELDNLIKK
jgi:glutamine synthetase type III